MFPATFLLITSVFCSSVEPQFEELEFISIHVLTDYSSEFDLSGIVEVEDAMYVISDKKWNHYAYQISIAENEFYITDSLSLGINHQSDIEAIDYCKDLGMFYADEEFNRVYQLLADGESQIIFNKGQLRNNQSWGENKGLEGLALDCDNKILYLAKEREPRFIISYSLEDNEVIDMINLDNPSGDISDLKVQNEFLYILERNENFVTKMNLSTKQIVSRVSFRQTCSHPNGKLYSNSKYGMAEALLLTPDEIWIGLDNNGMPFSEHAQQSYALYGNKPIIIRFKRPDGF